MSVWWAERLLMLTAAKPIATMAVARKISINGGRVFDLAYLVLSGSAPPATVGRPGMPVPQKTDAHKFRHRRKQRHTQPIHAKANTKKADTPAACARSLLLQNFCFWDGCAQRILTESAGPLRNLTIEFAG